MIIVFSTYFENLFPGGNEQWQLESPTIKTLILTDLCLTFIETKFWSIKQILNIKYQCFISSHWYHDLILSFFKDFIIIFIYLAYYSAFYLHSFQGLQSWKLWCLFFVPVLLKCTLHCTSLSFILSKNKVISNNLLIMFWKLLMNSFEVVLQSFC